jgi:restriction system protein
VEGGEQGDDEAGTDGGWENQLLDVLGKMDPIAFERLCQRLLRESGFTEVEVTRRSGDGGIDGHGLIRIGGLISFPVLFQSKRYASNIGPDVVRDFRGAMMGRADKGLIITTGGFTREARREATRDGAPPIDLIDGQTLVMKMKDLGLGVQVITRQVEEVRVDSEWFRTV